MSELAKEIVEVERRAIRDGWSREVRKHNILWLLNKYLPA